MRRVAIITGTGLYGLQRETADPAPERIGVHTPYGTQEVIVHQGDDLLLFHVPRHGVAHHQPPHRLDPRRTIDAIARCGVERVLALQNTGSLRPNLRAGDLVVPHDLVDLTGNPHHTFFDDEVTHIDFSHPYCPGVRRDLLAAVRGSAWDEARVHTRGVFIATRGPRFETPAETAFLGRLGDVVGMTGAGEAALAREKGLCYAAVAFVANPAAGVAGTPRTASEIRQALADEGARLTRILWQTAATAGDEKDCSCARAPQLGRLAGPANTGKA